MLRTLEISKKLRSRFLAVALSWRGYRGRTSAVALTGYPDRKLTLERVDAGKAGLQRRWLHLRSLTSAKRPTAPRTFSGSPTP